MNKKNAEEKARASRISFIDAEIRSGKYPNAEELAAKWGGVSTRTILRDIDYLRDIYDAPIEYDHTKHCFYYTEPNFFIRSVMLSKEELKTITEYDQLTKITTHGEDNTSVKFRKIIDKLLLVLPEDQTNNLLFIPTHGGSLDFIFGGSIQIDSEINHLIRMAVDNKEVIEIDYWISDNRKWEKREIEPLKIFYQRHHYYLLAWENDNYKKPGIYSINRFRDVKNTGKYFKVPDDFRISDYIKKKKETEVSPNDAKLYYFELSFPKEIASEAIEKTYYHNQHIKLCEDGTVYLSFMSTQLHGVYDWVFREGHRVKVLNPPELVNMIKTEVQKIAQYYK